MRRVLPAVACLVLLVAACSDDDAGGDTVPQEPTAAQMTAFCDRWDEVRDMSRSEYVAELAEVAPTAALREALERTSTRQGSIEYDDLIDEFLQRCETEQ